MQASDVTFRQATVKDLDAIVQMLADDNMGSTREQYGQPLPQGYLSAFDAICSDPNIELIVACEDDCPVGIAQLTVTPHLTYQGGWRATIEGVRIHRSARGRGIGSELIRWVTRRAKERGCHMVQLTTDRQRVDALRFYERLGFQATHVGLKLHI
ncbi:GNAT family N-acetyltransferase [Alicyclobacillus suci]|uniref:GNAT family N-acetyltransferase n=1 Tax=Alicyclobacillus suci TaxID=2816080 RepID=UPI001A8C23AA|nr:GNAT family N-acetyltransferase [Alicyclobacillus suci]